MRLNKMQAEAIGRAVGYIGVGYLTKWLHITNENAAIFISIFGELGVLALAMWQTRKRAIANALLSIETKPTDDDGVLISPNGSKDAHVMTVPKARHLARNVEHIKQLTKKEDIRSNMYDRD